MAIQKRGGAKAGERWARSPRPTQHQHSERCAGPCHVHHVHANFTVQATALAIVCTSTASSSAASAAAMRALCKNPSRDSLACRPCSMAPLATASSVAALRKPRADSLLPSRSAPAALIRAASSTVAGRPMHYLPLEDGRTLAYTFYGAPMADAAAVCIYHHGVPASLVEAEPLGAAGETAGVAVVAFDRRWGGSVAGSAVPCVGFWPHILGARCCCSCMPLSIPPLPLRRHPTPPSSGMGESSFNPLMSIASVVDDARQLQDALNLPTAVHVGESGGAPYAAAFAALHPTRCQQLLLLAGLAATNGKQNRQLRRCLNPMDRFCMSLGRVGGSHVINKFTKLAADVSAVLCCAALCLLKLVRVGLLPLAGVAAGCSSTPVVEPTLYCSAAAPARCPRSCAAHARQREARGRRLAGAL